MTPDEQLDLWLEGNPVHNNDRMVNGKKLKGGECCPDFSCCTPSLLAPKEVRELYVKAWREKKTKVTDRLLIIFLGNLLSGKNCYIAGMTISQLEED